jgi:pilus assembly protein CpaB
MTMTLFKGVKIITINRQTSQGVGTGGETNSVTLELSSEQANIIMVCRDKGKLDFSFNPDGKGTGGLAVTGKDRATLEEILGLQPTPKPPAPQIPFISQVYRGAMRRQLEFRQVGSKMMETGGGTINAVVPALQGGSNQNGPQQPGAAAGYDPGQAPPAPAGAGYDPGAPAPAGPAAQDGSTNPSQPAASPEKLF